MRIHTGTHWTLDHRSDSKLPGYLILSARDPGAGSLGDLPPEALAELGSLQGAAVRALEILLGARVVHVCRWGHSPGLAAHFHVLPICGWVERAYEADPLRPDPDPDGPAYDEWITRAFVEREDPPEVRGPSVEEVVAGLRAFFADRESPMQEGRPNRYLNTDLDLVTREPPTALLGPFEERGVNSIHSEAGPDGRWYSMFETNARFATPGESVGALLDAVEALDGPARIVWNTADRRDFSVGYDGGGTVQVEHGMAPETLARLAAAGASLRIVVYPREE